MSAPPPASVLCHASDDPNAPITNAPFAGARRVGDRGQADHEAGEGHRRRRVDRGQAQEARDQSVVGGRERPLRRRLAQRQEPGDRHPGEHRGGGEPDRALGGPQPRPDGEAGDRGDGRVDPVGQRGAQAGEERGAEAAADAEVDDQHADRPEGDGDREARDDAGDQSLHVGESASPYMRRSSRNRLKLRTSQRWMTSTA
jgi:hypothetical protein